MAKTFTLMGFIIATLRRASYRWQPRNEAMKRARIKRGWYKCEMCGKDIRKKEMALDHKLPIVPVTGWDNYDGFIERLFCNVDGFQVICKETCHHIKTQSENALRRLHKKAQS
jgi:hypothetical protein